MSGVVYFTPVHKDDEGGYNCTAFNDVGDVSSSGYLRVYGNYINTKLTSVFVVVKATALKEQYQNYLSYKLFLRQPLV